MASLRPARKSEAAELSALALRSKAVWGYDQAFMDACVSELTVSPGELVAPDQDWRVLEDSGRITGFYGLVPTAGSRAELAALFLEPSAMGLGLGRKLFVDAMARATDRGYKRVDIQGDPNAEHFIVAMGAERIGNRESGSIPGRQLPLFRIDPARHQPAPTRRT